MYGIVSNMEKRRNLMQSSTDINRKHKVNVHYFDSIGTEEKAYWLGFI